MARPKKQVEPTEHEKAVERLKLVQAEVAKINAAMRDPKGEISQRFKLLPEEKRNEILRKAQQLKDMYVRDSCLTDFNKFFKHVRPNFFYGAHLEQLAKVYQRIDAGEAVRVIINIAPRHGKSEHVSVAFPAWYLGKNPTKQIIQASCTMTLVEKHGQAVKDVIATNEYRQVFPDFSLSTDTKAKTKFKTRRGGFYFGTSTTASAVGFGADILIVDDPHGEQSAIGSEEATVMPSKEQFEQVWNWFNQMQMRLMPGGSILIVMQRWAPYDLTGRLVERIKNDPDATRWEVIEFPALLHDEDDEGKPLYDEEGQPKWIPLWPEFWPLKDLLKRKRDIEPWRWNAQYMQNPRLETSAIVKREWWKTWKGDRPVCTYIIQAWDTAYSEKTKSDFSAVTTWGVFNYLDDTGARQKGIILLNAWRGRVGFPELKRRAIEQYAKWKPDSCIIEAKAAGLPLIQELRRSGVLVQAYTPTWQTGDKTTRLNSVAGVFEQGLVYFPPTPWAEEVVDEVALFPLAEHDDYTDTVIMAMIRFRNGNFMPLNDDEKDDEDDEPRRRWGAFY